MRIGECLERVRPLMRERIAEDLREFNWEASFLAKLWFGNHDLHYEITPRERARTIEIGLHFEADPLTNACLLAAFRANARAIERVLENARIERWDRGWCRVWEPLPFRTPDTELAKELASRLAVYVNTLEPILRRELPRDVEWAESGSRATGARSAAKARASRTARP